jgi:hypothetical protein
MKGIPFGPAPVGSTKWMEPLDEDAVAAGQSAPPVRSDDDAATH